MGNLSAGAAAKCSSFPCEGDCQSTEADLSSLHQEEDPEELAKAALQGDIVRLEVCLMSGANLEGRHLASKGAWSDEDMTPLMLACSVAHVKCAAKLLEAKASVNAVTCTGKTPLHFAAASGRCDVGRLLVEFGADKACRDGKGRRATAYLQAARGMTLDSWRREFRNWLLLLKCEEDQDNQAERQVLQTGPFVSSAPEQFMRAANAAALSMSESDGLEVENARGQVVDGGMVKSQAVVPKLGAGFPRLGQPVKNYEVD